MDLKTRNQLLFLEWLEVNHPAIYRRVMPRPLGGLGWVQAFAAIANAVAQAGSIALQKKQADAALKLQKKQAEAEIAAIRQNALLEQNAARAAAGQAPVDASGRIVSSGTLSMQKILPFALLGGAGLIAIVALKR